MVLGACARTGPWWGPASTPNEAHHAGLAEHVLAGLERGADQRAVHVWPGTDDDGVQLGILHHRPPIGRGLGSRGQGKIGLCSGRARTRVVGRGLAAQAPPPPVSPPFPPPGLARRPAPLACPAGSAMRCAGSFPVKPCVERGARRGRRAGTRTLGIPNCCATAALLSALRLLTTLISTPGRAWSLGMCWSLVFPPAPMMPTRMGRAAMALAVRPGSGRGCWVGQRLAAAASIGMGAGPAQAGFRRSRFGDGANASHHC